MVFSFVSDGNSDTWTSRCASTSAEAHPAVYSYPARICDPKTRSTFSFMRSLSSEDLKTPISDAVMPATANAFARAFLGLLREVPKAFWSEI